MVERGSISSPRGFRAGAVYAGIKTAGAGKLDVALLASDAPCVAAAMFTRNSVRGAPVIVSQEHSADGRLQAIVVNAGVANVAMGAAGLANAREMCALAAARLGVAAADVLVGSTGVIGRPLPMDRIRDGIARIELREDGGDDFARAIITTDTRPKTLAARFECAGHAYTIGAAAKGSGMIHPDMATMFCFLTTDAPVERAFLDGALRDAVADSLNMISVDSDTSTSDTTALLANGLAGGAVIDASHPCAAQFRAALRSTCIEMAKMLARDGEGAEKLIEVRVEGAASGADARAAARTISASPLVKTAVHGNDPNWGRLLMAAGRSGARIDLGRARVWLGSTAVFAGEPLPFDEETASDELRGADVLLRLDLGCGDAAATAWGCDLTAEYVHINSDYTT
ncbi:MAG: bifunctional glutamate N-acetyltransferase/amino-acid acetyltransferase ArgJ [Dehalococcoidia bacterium]|nr:bifunctional glutamate N-acetyltransferase/amino-acid acetyltransferase ArgJ [Dehalococcoidia bacterium]